MLTRKFVVKFFVLALVVFSAAMLKAQGAASLTGTVTDTSGAVIPGASIELLSTATNAAYKTTANSSGFYSLGNVKPGEGYKLTVSKDGFKSVAVTDLYLVVDATRTQNATLSAGGSTQTVEVSAVGNNVTLNTTDATIGNNIDVKELNQLPIQDRTSGVTALFLQQPGVDSNQGAVTGARADQTEVMVDGMDVNDIASGQTFTIVANAPVDSVEQFNGAVAGLLASLGTGSGAQFQLVTKSGTNRFHGNVNEYHRDTTTEANDYFNNLDGVPRTPLIRNQFGGNIGGPIKRDKLFFFFDLADSRIIQSSTGEDNVPMDSYRAGTLNYINSGPGCGDSSRLNTQPGCITSLNATQVAGFDPTHVGFNPNVLSFINTRYATAHVNDPAFGDGVNTGGYKFTFPTPDIETTYVGRIDYNLAAKHKVYGRFTINRRNAVESLPYLPTDGDTHPFIDRSYGYMISHVWTIGSNKVNQAYYGDTISKFSFPDTYNPTGVNQYSFSGFDGPYTSFDGQKRRVPIPEVRDDFNWAHGSHSITFGGTFKAIRTNSNLITNFNFVEAGLQGTALEGGLPTSEQPGDLNMTGTGVGANDYNNLFASGLGVLGAIQTNYTYNNKGVAQTLGTGGPRAYRYFETEAYVGDTWKVTKKLTLSYGLRYQLNSVPYESHGSQSNPVIQGTRGVISIDNFVKDRITQQNAGITSNTGLPLYSYILGGKANHGPALYNMDYKDLAPRLAFAWTPYNSQKTVFNGSAAIVYDRTVINSVNFLLDQIPNVFANTQFSEFPTNGGDPIKNDPRLGANLAYSSSLNPAPLAATLPYTPNIDGTGTPFGLPVGETNLVVSPNLKDPYSINFNFGVQQELPTHMILKVNYVGRLGRRLLADADANGVINVPDYTGKSNQTMSQAFARLTGQLRAGATFQTLTPQPWFEDVLTPGTGAAVGPYLPVAGVVNNTDLVAYVAGQLAARGDMSDSLQALSGFSYFNEINFLPVNIGIPWQFGSNTYLTNKSSSNYHGMLVTLDKNLSQGLQFEFNYTWSHSIDNVSLSGSNNALFNDFGYLCDVLQPRACRGDSDFDVRQEFNGNFIYNLPVGRSKMLLPNSPRWLDEIVGGWGISGIPGYRTGLAVTAYSDAFLSSFNNDAPAIFFGNKSDLKAKVNVDLASQTVYSFAGGAAGAAKVAAEFRGPLGIEYGQRNLVRGPGAFTLDMGLGKTFPILADNRLNLIFRADAFDVLNHPNFGPPAGGNLFSTSLLSLVTGSSNFGQIVGSYQTPSALAVSVPTARVAQFSLRLEF